MFRKLTLILLMSAIAVSCAACGRENSGTGAASSQTETSRGSGDEEMFSADRTELYYSSDSFDTLIHNGTDGKAGPGDVISMLAAHNMAPIGTKVQGFDIKKENGSEIIYMDLSKNFQTYLSTMSEQSEAIIIAAVTDTYLKTFDADGMVLTVNGSVIQSADGRYDKTLKWDDSYKISEYEIKTSTEQTGTE